MGLEELMLPCVRPRQPELRRILLITWNTCLKTKAEHDGRPSPSKSLYSVSLTGWLLLICSSYYSALLTSVLFQSLPTPSLSL